MVLTFKIKNVKGKKLQSKRQKLKKIHKKMLSQKWTKNKKESKKQKWMKTNSDEYMRIYKKSSIIFSTRSSVLMVPGWSESIAIDIRRPLFRAIFLSTWSTFRSCSWATSIFWLMKLINNCILIFSWLRKWFWRFRFLL